AAKVDLRIVLVLAQLIPCREDSSYLIVKPINWNTAVEHGSAQLWTPQTTSICPGGTITRLRLVHSGEGGSDTRTLGKPVGNDVALETELVLEKPIHKSRVLAAK